MELQELTEIYEKNKILFENIIATQIEIKKELAKIEESIERNSKDISNYSKIKEPSQKIDKPALIPVTRATFNFPKIVTIDINTLVTENRALKFFNENYFSAPAMYNDIVKSTEYGLMKPHMTTQNLYDYLYKNHKDEFIKILKEHKSQIESSKNPNI